MKNKIWVSGYMLMGLGVFATDNFAVKFGCYIASCYCLYQVLRVDK